MAATFILSLDCEGKWGVADHLSSSIHQQLSDANLRAAYRDVVATLDEYAVAATFAFVGCFSVSSAELAQMQPQLAPVALDFPGYVGAAVEDFLRGSREGWAGDWAVDMTRSARSVHEVALHGATHLPWDNEHVSEEAARRELALFDSEHVAKQLAGATTFIYPRNAIAYPHLLGKRGIAGFRSARLYPSRVFSLLSELNLFAAPDAQAALANPIVIPPGYFINWLHGVRKFVPIEVTRLRARLMLRSAAADNRVVHFWTHPENIAAAPRTLQVLRVILEEAVRMRESGQCEIITQAAYCQRIAASAAGK